MNNGVLFKTNTLFQVPFSPTSPLLQTHRSFSSFQLPKHNLVSFHVKLSSGSPVVASTTPRKGETSIPGTDKLEFEDEFDEDFEEDDEDEDEDEDIIVPLRNMREWTRNKPLGFGEGKVYDTSIEEKLLEELEQSRAAQLANVNNLKNNPEDGNPNSKKEKLPKHKVPDPVPNGVRVRLVNLPKKKNIHRDLQVAFKRFSGIINISPAVYGNEKTREPVCKGFAFVDFKSEKEANRFVDLFSTEPITFGKVQKQIKCEIMKLSSPNPAPVKTTFDKTKTALPISNPDAIVPQIPVSVKSFDPSMEDAALDAFKNEEFIKFDNVIEEKHGSDSEPVKKQKKDGEKGKKVKTVKRKVENAPKLNIPGSANRLKMKEKALLSGVFSKYGGKSAMVAAKGTEVISD